MPWQLFQGSTPFALGVLRRPAGSLEVARSAELSFAGTIVLYGDALPKAGPMTLTVYVSGGRFWETWSDWGKLVRFADNATSIRYQSPTGAAWTRALQGMKAFAPTLSTMSRNYLEGTLTLLPTEPWWRDGSNNPVVLPII